MFSIFFNMQDSRQWKAKQNQPETSPAEMFLRGRCHREKEKKTGVRRIYRNNPVRYAENLNLFPAHEPAHTYMHEESITVKHVDEIS